MTRDPLGLPGHTPAYEAALEMIDHRFRHVLVTEADALVGVVSERDVFSLQRLGPGRADDGNPAGARRRTRSRGSPLASGSWRGCSSSRASPPST